MYEVAELGMPAGKAAMGKHFQYLGIARGGHDGDDLVDFATEHPLDWHQWRHLELQLAVDGVGDRVGEGVVSIVGDDDTKLHVYVCPANGIYYNGMRQDQNNNYYFTFTNDIGDNFYPRSIECITPFHSEDIDTYSVISSNSSIIEVVNSYIWVGRVHIILSVVGIGEATITTNITLNNGNQYSLSAIARPQTGLEFGHVNYYRF